MAAKQQMMSIRIEVISVCLDHVLVFRSTGEVVLGGIDFEGDNISWLTFVSEIHRHWGVISSPVLGQFLSHLIDFKLVLRRGPA